MDYWQFFNPLITRVPFELTNLVQVVFYLAVNLLLVITGLADMSVLNSMCLWPAICGLGIGSFVELYSAEVTSMNYGKSCKCVVLWGMVWEWTEAHYITVYGSVIISLIMLFIVIFQLELKPFIYT